MQPTKDDPMIVDVVYYGEHTCGYTAVHSRPTGSSNLQEESTCYDWIDQLIILPAPSNRKSVQVRVSSVEDVSPLDDGYSWRKYGQKDILGAKHPKYVPFFFQWLI